MIYVYGLVGIVVVLIVVMMTLFIMGAGKRRNWELDDEMQMQAMKEIQKKRKKKNA